MFSMCLLGSTGDSFQDFPRKLAPVNFRHMDAAKDKPHIARGSRKRWRKRRQNRTQIMGGSETAHIAIQRPTRFSNGGRLLQFLGHERAEHPRSGWSLKLETFLLIGGILPVGARLQALIRSVPPKRR